ncbi:CoA transferase [Ralstonia solanacearum]|uniref:CoA transferase n=1 Tax=Ralstonia solanacearum K60 TaxID=1091042 RepID=A0AAP7ZKY7_RALSL|nr:CaiB/BaiF CoA-transferase family protein [Ralstonia solanacearum]MBT1537980.1 CoA transferase [Ralstonia solanacearum]OYQ12062.1 CoA transferase [Ralstonia solanacearum K60]QOK82421.1 CoA transferase [Ralstonia solanacearum]RIJ88188.1 CoA transferase [Ralstonia solanacearum]CCF96193.1 putative alpha-methylacyl-CoA racemase [Ralstonia solanacearum K60]
MTSTAPDPAPHRPLTGVRVLDLTRLLPGPAATRHLADLGAEVIKIEDPGPGDYARDMLRTPADRAAGRPSLFFRALNRGKAELRLDLKRAEDREALIGHARHADVLIESFRPGVMARLGIGWETLRAANPALVMCSISGYGQDGPLAQAAGHDINYIGYAGMLDQLAGDNGTPIVPNVQIGDLLGGALTAAVGILAALVDARATGRGRHIDVSMTDAVFAHNLMAFFAVGAHGRASRAGTDLLNGGVPCYGVYRTADGRFMAVGALELKFWQALCDVIGRPEWKGRHWSCGQPVGGDEARALRDALAALFRSATQAEWIARFAGTDCCVTPVLRMEEALQHPLFAERNSVVKENGEPVQLALPLRFHD